MSKKICVVGTGYVGLIASVGLSDFGNELVGVDIDERKVAMLNGGISPIYEPGVERHLVKNLDAGRLRFTTDIAKATQDFFHPDRTVVGYESERAKKVMTDVYRALNLISVPFVWCDLETAELIKYASNAFLATKITFINQMANLAETVGADIHSIARTMGMDGRISPKFLHPGYACIQHCRRNY